MSWPLRVRALWAHINEQPENPWEPLPPPGVLVLELYPAEAARFPGAEGVALFAYLGAEGADILLDAVPADAARVGGVPHADAVSLAAAGAAAGGGWSWLHDPADDPRTAVAAALIEYVIRWTEGWAAGIAAEEERGK